MEEHKPTDIVGYRSLSPGEVGRINAIKHQGDQLGQLVEALKSAEDADQRCVALAITNLQQGLMWAVRAITKPGGF